MLRAGAGSGLRHDGSRETCGCARVANFRSSVASVAVATRAFFLTRPAPSGAEAPCAYLDEVLAFQTTNGGPFLGSLELEYAARALARAWMAAGLSERALRPWLRFAAVTAVGPTATAIALTRRLVEWAVDEYLLIDPVAQAQPSASAA